MKHFLKSSTRTSCTSQK